MNRHVHVRFTREHMRIDVSWSGAFKTLLCVVLALTAGLLPISGLDDPGPRVCFVIFALAASLWITELIPPYATSIIVMVACVYLLGRPGGWLGMRDDGPDSWQIFINPVASPVLVLFFGGLMLALAASKHGFDLRLARAFITPFGKRPSMVLLGVILTTALFSMFMSNTACTAMILAIVTPLISQVEGREGFKKAIVLAVPFAANVGGMGTIIGTPPNAVAAIALQQMGSAAEISFLGWMLLGVPLVLLLSLVVWVVLLLSYRPDAEPLRLAFPEELELTPGLLVVVVTFVLTIGLWLTQPLTGLPSAVAALVPVAVFTAFGIVTRDDLKQIDWDVLILVAGGMTLGVAMKASGLSDVVVRQVPFERMPPPLLLASIAATTVLISNFMSHTSGTNLLMPIVTSIAAASPKTAALAVALSASLAMSLPISTPPNALAFATRQVSTRDFLVCGTLISLIGLLLVIVLLVLGGAWIARL